MKLDLKQEPNRIYAKDENGQVIAEITYPAVSDQAVDINHTFVDASLRGLGAADRLMRAAVEDIQKKGLKTRTSCPYAAKWFSNHTEFSDLLD